MKKKRIICGVLAVVIALGVVGCTKEPKEKSAEKQVTLKWFMPGPGEQQDTQSVLSEFNKKLKTYEGFSNLTIEADIIPVSDYKQKFLLAQTSGEMVDITQTYTLDFANEARNGTFVPMSKLVETYGKDLKKELPQWVWKYGTVDEELYIVPNYQQMCSALFGIIMPKKLADKYMDKEKFAKAAKSSAVISPEWYEAMEDYLKKAKAGGEIGKGYHFGAEGTMGLENVVGPYYIRKEDGKPKIFNGTKDNILAYKTMRSWFEKGYIRPDVLSAKASDDDGRADGNIMWTGQSWRGSQESYAKKFGFEVEIVQLQDKYYMPFANPAGGNGIMSVSKNQETAMKFIDLMNTKKGMELSNLLIYGMEGNHYNKIGNDKIETIGYTGYATSTAKYGLWRWIVGNSKYAYDTQDDPDGWKDYVYKEINEGDDSVYSKLLGFVPDLSNIESKLAQVRAICTQYGAPLASGSLPNYETVYKEMADKLKKAGDDEIIAELQKQIDDFIEK